MNDIKISDNFKLSEFECKCGCRTVKLHSELLRRLQAIRTQTGRPVRITSGYRCPAHNRAVGGATASRHMLGDAVDFQIVGMPIAQQRKILDVHFADGGRGYGTTFCHGDLGAARWWNY